MKIVGFINSDRTATSRTKSRGAVMRKTWVTGNAKPRKIWIIKNERSRQMLMHRLRIFRYTQGRFIVVILRGFATCDHLKALRLMVQLEQIDSLQGKWIPSVAG